MDDTVSCANILSKNTRNILDKLDFYFKDNERYILQAVLKNISVRNKKKS